MKKKIILVVIVVFAVAVSGAFVLTKCLKTNSNHEQVNVVEDKDEEFNLQEEEQSKGEITTETDENENKTANGKSESPKEDTSKQENKSKTSTKVSETPKNQKLNLAMYQLQVANHKKKNKRIKQPKVIKIMVQVIKDNRTKSQQLFMILLLTEKKSFLLKMRL